MGFITSVISKKMRSTIRVEIILIVFVLSVKRDINKLHFEFMTFESIQKDHCIFTQRVVSRTLRQFDFVLPYEVSDEVNLIEI